MNESIFFHVGTTGGGLSWAWEPSVLIGIFLAVAGYALITGPFQAKLSQGEITARWKKICFYAGMLALFVALVSPLDTLGDEYLFSAHMTQHMLLTFVAPPLWLLGIPDWLYGKILTKRVLRRTAGFLVHPAVAFIVFNGMMWIWHLPRMYDAALENENLHIVEHLLFMSSAVIGWWPVFGPRINLSTRSLQAQPYPVRIGYLFASSFPCTALAAIITFSSQILYPFYGNQPAVWGMTPQIDQQLGGLLMWLPGDMILMSILLWMAAQWLKHSAQESRLVEEYHAISRRT